MVPEALSPHPAFFIRADAGPKIGSGHLMRCLALAQALRDQGGRAFFFSLCPDETLRRRILDEGFRVLRAGSTGDRLNPGVFLDAIRDLSNPERDWIVLDGYDFGPEYQEKVKAAGLRVLVLDDLAHLPRYHADAVLNPNLGAESLPYRLEPGTHRLFGPTYALLKSEFRTWRGFNRTFAEGTQHVLVTLGGADQTAQVEKIVRALTGMETTDFEAVVLGGFSGDFESDQGREGDRIRYIERSDDMPTLMAQADIAISGGGGTCWEMAFFGLPNCILVLADNQNIVAEHLDRAGASINLGRAEEVTVSALRETIERLLRDPELRRRMSDSGRSLVDGRGADRAVSFLLAFSRGEAPAGPTGNRP